MLTSQLLDKIIGEDRESGIVNDTDYTEAMVLLRLNEAQLSVCGGGERSHGLPILAPMPDLLTSDTVTLAVDDNSVSMPSTFHREPVKIVTSGGCFIKSIESHLSFLDKYPTLTVGDTLHFCRKGSTLHYAPAKAQDVTTHFYRLPVDMTLDVDSEPDGIPAHLQERLLVSYVVKGIFAEIEDGIDGSKVNTGFWHSTHQSALTDLERFIGPADKELEVVQDDTEYIGSF